MDPVSHLLFGRTVAMTLERRHAMRGATAALVLGSILPDADAMLALRGFDVYLRAHASGTHSLTGTIIEALVLAAGLHLVVRGSSLSSLLIAAWIGISGHVLWDLADGSDINVLTPFLDGTFGWHLVAMGEPAVLLILACAIVTAWRWPFAARRIAVAALVALAALLTVKKGSQEAARGRYAASIGSPGPMAIAVAPEFGRLFAWTIYDRVGDRVRAWQVDVLRGTALLAFERRDAPDAPDVALSRGLPIVRTFLSVSKIPFVRVEHEGPDRLVLWSDVRECSVAGCDLSFGGAFDRTMAAPLYQLIEIGGFRQRRPLPLEGSLHVRP